MECTLPQIGFKLCMKFWTLVLFLCLPSTGITGVYYHAMLGIEPRICVPGISLRMANTNLETKKKNPKKNFKTTFHNSRDDRKEARRHLFVVLGQLDMEQRMEKTEKKIVFLCGWEDMLSFVGAGEPGLGCEPAMTCFRLRFQLHSVFSVFITWGKGGAGAPLIPDSSQQGSNINCTKSAKQIMWKWLHK